MSTPYPPLFLGQAIMVGRTATANGGVIFFQTKILITANPDVVQGFLVDTTNCPVIPPTGALITYVH